MRPFVELNHQEGQRVMCEKLLTPQNITDSEMKEIAREIADYLYEFNECMIIPKDMYERDKDRILQGRKLVKKLIKKLDKGDRKSVFKEEWEYE